MKRWIVLFFPFVLAAYEGSVDGKNEIQPWFTGPILATSGNVVTAGHFNVEPYVFAFARTSFYDHSWNPQPIDTLWNVQFKTPFWVGLTSWSDVKVNPVWGWNYRKGRSQWVLGDWSAKVSFQLYRSSLSSKSWTPSIKVSFRETFPTGKYQKLNPDKLGTDGGGSGAWVNTFSLNLSKVYQIYETHFLNFRLNLQYSLPTSVHVKGFNAYGGGIGTNGVVDPEKTFLAIFAFEYALSRNWVIACDFQGVYSSKTTFSGYAGIVPGTSSDVTPSGVPALNESKASIQYSMAPAIEYNWSQNLGLIAGVWLTVAGKNASRFTTGVIALNYYN